MSEICGCQTMCGGYPKPVHRSTWFRHKQYRDEEKLSPEFRAFIANNSRQSDHPNNPDRPLENNPGRAQPSRKRPRRDDTDEPDAEKVDAEKADADDTD